MKMRLLTLAVAAVIAAPVPALALDEAAVMQRLEQLEAQRRADQAEIQVLRQKVEQLQPGSSSTVVSSSEAQQLRAEIAKIDQRASYRVESLKKSVDSEREKLTVNGFMSGYAVKSTDDAVRLGSTYEGDSWNFRSDTVAGIQFSYRLDDKTDAVVQLLAQGNDDYELEASWAFLRYAMTPDTTIRVGRLALPLFLYTETIDVGFTYPWVRPPVEFYGVGAYRFQGVDIKHDMQLGDWGLSLQAFAGDNDHVGERRSSKLSSGLAATLARDSWTFHAAYNLTNDLQSHGSPQAAGLDAKFSYMSLGARYDDGSWLAIVEGSRNIVDGSLEVFSPSTDSFYGTLGYQLDRFMPYVTAAKSYSVDDGGGFVKSHQESVGLGLRYNLTNKVVLKGEATRYSSFDGTMGVPNFVTVPSTSQERGDLMNRLDDDGVTIMSIGFDAIF